MFFASASASQFKFLTHWKALRCWRGATCLKFTTVKAVRRCLVRSCFSSHSTKWVKSSPDGTYLLHFSRKGIMIPSALPLRCFCNGSDCRALVPHVQLEFWSWLFHLKTKCCLVRFFFANPVNLAHSFQYLQLWPRWPERVHEIFSPPSCSPQPRSCVVTLRHRNKFPSTWMSLLHCVRLIKAEWTAASLERTLQRRVPWSSLMPQIVLIRLIGRLFPEVISHLVPAYYTSAQQLRSRDTSGRPSSRT